MILRHYGDLKIMSGFHSCNEKLCFDENEKNSKTVRKTDGSCRRTIKSLRYESQQDIRKAPVQLNS